MRLGLLHIITHFTDFEVPETQHWLFTCYIALLLGIILHVVALRMCPMTEATIEEWSLTNTSCFILHSALCGGRQSPEDASALPMRADAGFMLGVDGVNTLSFWRSVEGILIIS